MTSPRVWLSTLSFRSYGKWKLRSHSVTGTSSGLRRALTEYILAKGEIVVATARRPAALNVLGEQYASDRLFVLRLDTKKPEEIVDVFAQDTFGRLNVVVNYAGYAVSGEVEATKDEGARGRQVLPQGERATRR